MEITLKLSFDDQALGAISALTAAISGIGGAPAKNITIDTTVIKTESTTKAADGPIYWANSETGEFGKVNKEADYSKLKKKSDSVYKITPEIFEEKQVALKAKNEAAKAAASAAKETPADKGASKASTPTIEDIVAAFSAYLPKDLDADERKARAGFVKPMLDRFGAKKATEIPEEHRALAINLVQRKMAGEDVDPATDELAEVAGAAEEQEEDLV